MTDPITVCPNCGASREGNASVCEYCNTPFQRKEGEESAADILTRIDTLRHLCKYDEALELTDKSIEKDPSNKNLWVKRAEIQYFDKKKKDEECLTTFSRVIELLTKGGNSDKKTEEVIGASWSAKGNIYLQLENYPAAIECLKKATEYPIELGNVYNNLGVCYEAMGNQTEALNNYKKAVNLNPNHQLYLNNLKEVEETLRVEKSKRDNKNFGILFKIIAGFLILIWIIGIPGGNAWDTFLFFWIPGVIMWYVGGYISDKG